MPFALLSSPSVTSEKSRRIVRQIFFSFSKSLPFTFYYVTNICSFLPCLSEWLSTVFLANVDKVIDLQISIAVLDLKKKKKRKEDCSYIPQILSFSKNCLNFNYDLWPTDL